MRWYDYAWCLLFSDLISASLISYNIIGLTLGVIGYIIYERLQVMRKDAN